MQLKFLFVLAALVALAYAATEPLDLVAEETQLSPANAGGHVRQKRTILLAKKAALVGGALLGGKILLAKKALLLGAGVGGAALLYRAATSGHQAGAAQVPYVNGYSNSHVYLPPAYYTTSGSGISGSSSTSTGGYYYGQPAQTYGPPGQASSTSYASSNSYNSYH